MRLGRVAGTEAVLRFLARIATPAWLEEQYARGVFLLSGRRVPREGGFILARGIDRPELDAILDKDPFKAADVAAYQVIEVAPTMAAEPLAWLKA